MAKGNNSQKKEKKKLQKLAKDEEKAKKDAEKANQEAAAREAEEKRLEEQRQRREEQRKKREAEKKAAEEERLRKDAEKQTIVAAVTGGQVDNLMVGRNGVFYDRQGNDWDATITRIVENPISVREAFFAPYKRFVRLIDHPP